MAIYLYGITETTKGSPGEPTGTGPAGPVRAVAFDGLTCLVGDWQGGGFNTLPKEQLVRRLLSHQQVTEQAMQGRTILPVKFGTLLADANEVLDLLAQGRSQLVTALDAMSGKVEMEVAGTWDLAQVLRQVSLEEEIAQARLAIVNQGQLDMESRLRLGQLVKAHLDQRRRSYQERMVAALQTVAMDVAPNALVSEELVMNVAFLIDQRQKEEFEDRVRQLDMAFQSAITFRLVGPLPPYSFSSIEIIPLDPEEVEEARRTLGLAGPCSEPEVRKAYRRLAAQAGRGLEFENGRIADYLTDLRRSSQLLLSHCQAEREAHQGAQLPRPWRSSGHLFAISVKRSSDDEIESTRFSGTVVLAGRSEGIGDD